MTEITKNITGFVKHLGFTPTVEQTEAFEKINDFLHSKEYDTFILTGAAGTGKTSMLKTVVNYLSTNDQPYVLLAPTGRAAGIISSKTGFPASTIHSHLYRVVEKKDEDGNVLFIEFVKRQNHQAKSYLYLIDESSMVGDTLNNQDFFTSKKPLLEDLIQYIREGHNNNKIIFIGDPYQLPPINADFSPALSPEYLEKKYHLKTVSFELTEVKRQEENSYILNNAIELRSGIINRRLSVNWRFESLQNEDQIIRQYSQNLNNGSAGNSIFLAWKNVSINNLNNRLRKILGRNGNSLVPGERLILHQSNYAGTYLASGTFLIVDSIIRHPEEIAGFHFATVKLRKADSGELLPGTFTIDLDTLLSENGRVEGRNIRTLWHDRFKKNKQLRETKDARTDPYLSALKVRYAYAITTHKAQGGEWDHVYLYPELPFGTNGLRWLYTSVTRARKHLYSFH